MDDSPLRGNMDANSHFTHSTLRERIVEHVFVGDALRRLWQLDVTDVEVLRAEFNSGGYDLVMSFRKTVRHIQLKTGKAASIKVSLKLMDKPSGCVIWINLTPELHLHSYLWFGGAPGEPFPDIRHLKVAKQTRSNTSGVKTERPNLRILPRGRFQKIPTLDALLYQLFGSLT